MHISAIFQKLGIKGYDDREEAERRVYQKAEIELEKYENTLQKTQGPSQNVAWNVVKAGSKRR